MRHSLLVGILCVGVLLVTAIAMAQEPEAQAPVGTMADVMVGMTYPAANEILLSAARGGPSSDKEWMALQRSAVLLGESANVLLMRGRIRDQGEWVKASRMMADAGASAYRAARAKDVSALSAVAEPLNASCIACHTRYRPNVHPRR